MKTFTVSLCKPWEREWHRELVDELRLVDVVARLLKGKPPISWAKTRAEFDAGRGMRIDHGLAKEELMDPAQRPLISAHRA
jgi:exonuclease III